MQAYEPERQDSRCPICDSTNTLRTRRGYTGQADTPDQYITCRDCGAKTYEIISCTGRELRVERLEPGRRFKHHGAEYVVARILKVGLDEALVYVRPAPPHPTFQPG